MKHIAQILSFSLALILAITFTTPVFADTNPPEDTAHAYHFRTAKEYDAPRYVLNCHTNGAVVSGTKVSLWQATGDISQEWYVDWTSYGQYNRTAVLRSNQNKSLALNANRSAVGTICDMLPSNGNIYNDYNVTLEGDHSVSPTQVKLRLPARYNHTSPVFVTETIVHGTIPESIKPGTWPMDHPNKNKGTIQ